MCGILGAATYYSVKTGYFKGNPRWGAAPKVACAVVFGFFLGKISYQAKCAEMLMQIPNSRLAEILKQRKKGSVFEQFTPDQGYGTGLSLAPFSSPAESYSDEPARKSSSLDLDTSRPNISGLDDVYRPTLDNAPPIANYDDLTLPLEPLKPGVSYDELRKKNREEYFQRQQQNQLQVAPPSGLPPATRAPVIRQPELTPEEREARKNKYGDVWSETK